MNNPVGRQKNDWLAVVIQQMRYNSKHEAIIHDTGLDFYPFKFACKSGPKLSM